MPKYFLRIEGIKGQEVYSPISRYVLVSLAVSVSVMQRYKRRLLDVRKTFVKARLKELLDVSHPDGFAEVVKNIGSSY